MLSAFCAKLIAAKQKITKETKILDSRVRNLSFVNFVSFCSESAGESVAFCVIFINLTGFLFFLFSVGQFDSWSNLSSVTGHTLTPLLPDLSYEVQGKFLKTDHELSRLRARLRRARHE